MKALFSILAIFLTPASIVAQTQDTIHTKLDKAIQHEQLTGAVWATVDANRIQTGAVGVNNADTQSTLHQDDKVLVGSIAKTLIATGILRLVSQNALDLNAPIKMYLPDIRIDNPWQRHTPITITHLLNHSAGIENFRFWQVFHSQATPDTPIEILFSRSPKTLKVSTEPGSHFSYSNIGYALLALIIEKVSQQRYERFLDTHLLTPLGMHNSTFEFTSQAGAYHDPRLSMGHFEGPITQVNLL